MQMLGGWLSIVIFFWFLFVIHPRGASWDGGGEINAFPQNAESKNYRLEADMTATIKGKSLISNYTEYSIMSATWPNGGRLGFRAGCTVSELQPRSVCVADDGKNYRVEVATPPEAPSN